MAYTIPSRILNILNNEGGAMEKTAFNRAVLLEFGIGSKSIKHVNRALKAMEENKMLVLDEKEIRVIDQK